MPTSCTWALTALLFGGTPAEAQPTFRLEYRRAPEASACPDAAALRGEIAGRIGRDPFQEPPAQVDRIIEVTVRRPTATELEASVVLRDAAGQPLGTRAIRATGNDCTELTNSLVLALSIAIDPLSLGQPAAPPAPPPTPPAPAPPPSPAPAPPPPPESPSIPIDLSLSAGAALSFGLSPSAALGARVGAELRRGAFSLGLEGQGFVPASEDVQGGEISAAPLLLGLAPCAHLGLLAGCALVEGGAINGSASGPGIVSAQSRFTPLVALGARLQADFPLNFLLSGRIALRPQAELLVPLIQTTLDVRNGASWISSPVAGALAIALVVALP